MTNEVARGGTAPGGAAALNDRAQADRDGSLAPGSPQAAAHGCRCPMLANAPFRVGAEPDPVLAPDCDLHPLSAPFAG